VIFYGAMEPMSPMDASFLHVENDTTPMHIGSVSVFEGPPPPFERLREMVASKLHLVPRYRQKVRFVPLHAGSPVWVEDPHFSLDYHLRHSGIPAPGTGDQLRRMAGRVFSQHLDRSKPLGPSSPSTRSAGVCSSPTPTCRSSARSGSSSRSSPTTAACFSA
jgi:diacylglycerol O-acyltransferase